jgi:hypothetical protein
MSSQISRLSFLYATGVTARWRAVAEIDAGLAGLYKQHWLADAPRQLAPVAARYRAVRPCGATAAKRTM